MKTLRAFAGALAFTCSFAVSVPAYSTVVDGNVGEIVKMYTYTDYGSGDVVITVQSPLATCQAGFWLRMTDVGAKTTYAFLLAALQTKAAVRLSGYDDQLWAGSSGHYCRLHMAGIP